MVWAGTYKLQNSVFHELKLRNLIGAIFYSYILTVIFGFFSKTVIIGRLQAVYTFAIIIPMLITSRFLVDSLMAKIIFSNKNRKNILICGAGDTGKRLVSAVRKYPKLNYHVVGFLDDRLEKGFQVTSNPVYVLDKTENIHDVVKNENIDEVWIAMPRAERDNVINLINSCNLLGVAYKFVPNLNELALNQVCVESLDGVPLFGIKSITVRRFNLFLKRGFDIIFSVLIIALSSLLWGLIAVLIKIDSRGPVFFKQKRVGYKGKEFLIYKFRSMHEDAKPYEKTPTNPADPRITKVGRFLRRTSLDEMPQFINVLKGDMSIVGPRPEMPFIVKGYDRLQRERLNVKPGITGLWQISGDRSLPIHENIYHDLFYIEHQSPLLDLIIVFETIIFAIKGRGAY